MNTMPMTRAEFADARVVYTYYSDNERITIFQRSNGLWGFYCTDGYSSGGGSYFSEYELHHMLAQDGYPLNLETILTYKSESFERNTCHF